MRASNLALVCTVAMAFLFGRIAGWAQPPVPHCDVPHNCIPPLNFDSFCDGTAIPKGFIIQGSQQPYADWGVTFSVKGRDGDTTFNPSKNVLMTFDSKNPSAGQRDLGAPNTGCDICKTTHMCPGFCTGQQPGMQPPPFTGEGCGGRSNCDTLGNVLIISADGNADVPRSSDKGGVITVDFKTPIKIGTLRFLDVDQKDGKNGNVKFFFDGNKKSDKIPIPKGGDNGISKLKFDYKDVHRIEIEIVGTVALVDILPQEKDLCGSGDQDNEVNKKCWCRCRCKDDNNRHPSRWSSGDHDDDDHHDNDFKDCQCWCNCRTQNDDGRHRRTIFSYFFEK